MHRTGPDGPEVPGRDRVGFRIEPVVGIAFRLADREFVAGDYSIADMASYPWIIPEAQGQDLAAFPHLARWHAAIKARPATQRAYAKAKEVRPEGQQPMSEEAKKLLFGQTASTGR